MKEKERYIVRVIFENEKKIFVKQGVSSVNAFFESIFNEYPNAKEVTLRKIYNPLYSDSEIDDQRTFIARSRNTQFPGQNYSIQESQEEILFPRSNYPEEISDE